MRNVAVIAGNKNQFAAFAREIIERSSEWQTRGVTELIADGVRYFYLHDATGLKGRRKLEFLYIGTFFTRPDLEEIRQEERIATFTRGD